MVRILYIFNYHGFYARKGKHSLRGKIVFLASAWIENVFPILSKMRCLRDCVVHLDGMGLGFWGR